MKTPLLPAILALAGCSIALGAQAPGKALLLVLAKSDNAMVFVDPATRQVLGRTPAGPDPHEVVVAPDGRHAYVSNYGAGSGGYNTLTVVDLVTRATLPTVDLGGLRAPHGLFVAGGAVWFTAEASKAIGRYNPRTQKVDLVLGTGQNGTHMVALTPDGSRIVTTNIQSATVSIFEAAPAGRVNWNQSIVTVGRGAEGFDISPDGKTAWVANAQDGTISVIDLVAKSLSATLEANVRGANRLKFTPDGTRVLVTSLSGPAVAVFDAASRKETARVEVGKGAAGLEMQPDGSYAYVACTPDDNVAVLDLKTLTIVGRIPVARQPDGLAWVAAR